MLESLNEESNSFRRKKGFLKLKKTLISAFLKPLIFPQCQRGQQLAIDPSACRSFLGQGSRKLSLALELCIPWLEIHSYFTKETSKWNSGNTAGLSPVPREGLGHIKEILKSVHFVVGVVVTINSYMIFILLPTSWCGLGFRLSGPFSVLAEMWGNGNVSQPASSTVGGITLSRECTFIAASGQCFFCSSGLRVCLLADYLLVSGGETGLFPWNISISQPPSRQNYRKSVLPRALPKDRAQSERGIYIPA